MLISSLLVLQAVLWLLAPKLIREGQIKLTMSILLLIIMFQFLPKVYHSLRLMRKMTKVTGFIFGTIWWGFTINLIAYLIFSHVSENSYRQPRILQQQHELSSRFNDSAGYRRMLVRFSHTTRSFMPPTTMWKEQTLRRSFSVLLQNRRRFSVADDDQEIAVLGQRWTVQLWDLCCSPSCHF